MGRVAQWYEHYIDIVGVGSSILPTPTIIVCILRKALKFIVPDLRFALLFSFGFLLYAAHNPEIPRGLLRALS